MLLVSVPMPPPPSRWQNFGSGNLRVLKIILQKRIKSQTNPTKPNQTTTKKSQISFLICFFFVTCPFPMNNCASLADPGGLGREEESLFQLVLPAKKAVSATLGWVCGFRSWSEAIWQCSAAGRGMLLLTCFTIKPRWQGGPVAGRRSGRGRLALSDGCFPCCFWG